jgi:glycerophosphoryl diester phosphodiesterase
MSDVKSLAGKRPLVIAHRGASAAAPENTIPAFQMAVDVGADVIELDLLTTRDCKVVCKHDDVLERTTDRWGMLSEWEYDRLRWADAGYHFTMDNGHSFPFRGQDVHIPLFEDVLRRFPTVPIIAELKGKDPALVPSTIRLLDKFGRLNDGSVLITSFNHKHMMEVRRSAPESFSGCSSRENIRLVAAAGLHARWLFGQPRVSFQLPAYKAGLPITTRRTVKTAHKLGMEVFTYTVDEWDEMRRYLDMGVDGIITNYPHRLRIVVNNRE